MSEFEQQYSNMSNPEYGLARLSGLHPSEQEQEQDLWRDQTTMGIKIHAQLDYPTARSEASYPEYEPQGEAAESIISGNVYDWRKGK